MTTHPEPVATRLDGAPMSVMAERNQRPGPAEVPASAATLQQEIVTLANTIRDDGDVIDQLHWLQYFPSMGGLALTGMGMAAFHETVITSYSNFLQPGTIVLAGTSVIVGYASKGRRVPRAKTQVEPLVDRHEVIANRFFDGEPVELYRRKIGRKQYDLRLLWEGPTNSTEPFMPRTVKQRLQTLSLVAQTAQATDITVPRAAIEDFLDGISDADKAESTYTGWLKDTKNYRIEDCREGDDQVVTLTPEGLDHVIENITEMAKEEPLEMLIDILRQQAPNHPLVKLYQSDMHKSPKLQDRFRRAVRQTLERDLDETTRFRTLNTEDPEEPFWDLRRSHHRGYLQDNNQGEPVVQWRDQANFADSHTVTLLEQFGLTAEQLERLPDAADYVPRQQLIKQCEAAIWLALESKLAVSEGGQLRFVQRHPPLKDGKEGDVLYQSLQARITRQILEPYSTERQPRIDLNRLVPRRLIRTLASIGLVAAIGIGLGQVSNVIEQGKSDDIEHYDTMPPGIDDLVINVNHALRKVVTVDKAFIDSHLKTSDRIDSRSTKSQQHNATMGGSAEVGNVNDAPNRPLWFVNAYGGMKTNGYWLEEAFDPDSSDRMAWTNQIEHLMTYYAGMPLADAKQIFYNNNGLPAPNKVSLPGQHILVTRDIHLPHNGTSESSESWETYRELVPESGYFIVPVPVLEDTRIAAASTGYEGGWVQTMETESGNPFLVVYKPVEGAVDMSLTYVLIPSDDAKVTSVLRPQNTELDAAWEREMETPLAKNGPDRVRQQKEYLKSFDYEMAPFADEAVIDNVHDFAEATFEGNEANCNTAGSLLARSNPNLLTYVTGFMNGNNDQQEQDGKAVLSTAEAHAWTVDTEGVVQDATPPDRDDHGVPDSDENFDLAKKKQDITPAEGLLIGGSAAASTLGLGLTAYGLHQLYVARRRRAQKQLEQVDVAEASLAYEALGHALYAPRPLDSTALSAIAERKITDPAVAQKFADMFGRHGRRHTRKLLKRARQNTKGKQARDTVKQAASIVTLARRGHDPRSKPSTDR